MSIVCHFRKSITWDVWFFICYDNSAENRSMTHLWQRWNKIVCACCFPVCLLYVTCIKALLLLVQSNLLCRVDNGILLCLCRLRESINAYSMAGSNRVHQHNWSNYRLEIKPFQKRCDENRCMCSHCVVRAAVPNSPVWPNYGRSTRVFCSKMCNYSWKSGL